MKVEILSVERTETIELPSDTDYVGVKLDLPNGHTFSVNMFDFPDELCGRCIECHTEQRALDGGMTVTVYAYCLNGAARVLSLKGYEGLVFCDLSCGDVRFRFIV